MKYRQPTFSVGGAAESYDDGFERTFGKREATKGRWVYRANPDTGEVEAVQVDADWTDAPRTLSGTEEVIYGNLRATDGTPINSRTKHRNYMKANGLCMAGDFTETHKSQRVHQAQAEKRERRDAIGRALYQSRSKPRR